ncbi:MAG: SCO family protein [Gemmataceae bacterium]|nr:SCO family protein [Gemmataceae bacterium]
MTTALRTMRAVLFVLMVAMLGLMALRGRPGEPLDDFGELGRFSFTSSTGAKLTDGDLKDKVAVYACFFTCCTTQCPALSGAVARLQGELADLPDVRLVSITVDPEHDSPEKLRAYAETFGAKPDRWLFLTGDRADVEQFVTKQLKQGLDRNTSKDATPGNKFDHSDRLTLVDRHGRVRGWFPATTPEGIEQLKKAVRQLHG